MAPTQVFSCHYCEIFDNAFKKNIWERLFLLSPPLIVWKVLHKKAAKICFHCGPLRKIIYQTWWGKKSYRKEQYKRIEKNLISNKEKMKIMLTYFVLMQLHVMLKTIDISNRFKVIRKIILFLAIITATFFDWHPENQK